MAQYPITSISALRNAAAVNGSHFFDAASLRFFRSRIGTTVYGARYFVTSEQFVPYGGDPEPRKYSVREFRLSDGDFTIDTVGTFQQFSTLAQAQAAAMRLAKFMGTDSQDKAYPTPESGLIAGGVAVSA